MTRDDRKGGDADRAELASIGRIVIQAHERADQFQDESDARDRAERLRALAAQLAAAVTVADVAQAVAAEGVRTLDAATAALASAPASGGLEVAADVGGLLAGEPPFHVCASEILADVLSSAEPRFLDDVRAAGWRFPQAARFLAIRGLSAAVILPLVVQGTALGVVVFAFDRPQKSDAARRGFLELIAGQAAQALERARLHSTVLAERAVHERARRRAEFAADVRSLRQASTAALIFFSALRLLLPITTQPGISGHTAPIDPSSFSLKRAVTLIWLEIIPFNTFVSPVLEA